MPEGGTVAALYKSTNWGDSWTEVSSDLPENLENILNYITVDNIGSTPGLLLACDYPGRGFLYISTNGNEWVKVSEEEVDDLIVTAAGQVWLFDGGGMNGSSSLYSIGGPLRSGRLFHYQKD
jgi:hypothetical protein